MGWSGPIERIRDLLAGHALPGAVLTTPAAVAWATAGLNVPIDRAAAVDTTWLAVGATSTTIVTTNVEAARLVADPARPGDVDVIAEPWWDADAMIAAAADALAAPPAQLASDGHPAFGVDLSHQLCVARIPLTGEQQADLRDLGRLAAAAVEDALRAWRAGEADRRIAGRIAGAVEELGGQCPVLIVGGDERIRRFRHPLAVGAPVERLAMAVLVASRRGLHVALTRFASRGGLDPDLAAGLAVARSIHRDVLEQCRHEPTLGTVMERLADAYADHGHRDAWSDHYQGGPIGYAQREAEIAPTQTDSRWWDVRLPVGSAVAFNPSVSGGAKDEDTYLVLDTDLEWITSTGDWPIDTTGRLPRPAVLELTD